VGDMDVLTGLPSRKEAFAQLELSLNAARAAGKRMIVALVDLDRFYRLNETRGTDFGNEVLIIIGKRLMAARQASATVSRVGGNRFLISAPLEADVCQAMQALEAIKNAVERPIDADGIELYLTSSIGATLFPQDGLTSEQLICRAESALYQSKEQGGNHVRFYNTEDTIMLNRRSAIEAALRPALYLRQFRISYQPIYRMAEGKLRGFEALIRWEHPELGEIAPSEFLPLAEQNGLILPIGEWVLREACKMIVGMSTYGLCSIIISVNVSTQQLMDATFSQTLKNILKEYQISPTFVELEITDNTMLYSSDIAINNLNWLRAAGVCIALDNFGIGYSSLLNLKKLPIQCLKIDKLLIKKIDLEGSERIIVEGIIKLIHKLGIEVIAAGVEYKEQYELLSEWGCNYVQGVLLGKPQEPEVLDLSMIRRSKQNCEV
jgi:diguanylate cyclase (GGDEF)-like protein